LSDDPGRHEVTEQVLGAEQDERRRIALFLHDGPVQS
jgi:signal transduction histidine kinase